MSQAAAKPDWAFIAQPYRDSLPSKASGPGSIMGSINASVDLRRDGDVAVVTADNPPVNALKHEVRAGLAEALRQARDDAAVKAVVIACAGRTFFAGAD
ncbi:MAG: enoyl-CoA hydratase-related protein, partial [Stellaceae bacterium]